MKADAGVELFTYTIEGNDFKAAGAASRAVKEHLKRVGADAESIRRTMIAAYEAEMNVVIHAYRGRLDAWLSDTSIAVDVIDEGPGIADVELAMREGYSTATADARALGFGAGMGLPNIRRSSDRLRVTSRIGEGTRVSFTVNLQTEAGDRTRPAAPLSLYVSPGRCTCCRRCLAACPTQALRVRNGRPVVLEHLCIDCASCINACRVGALTLRSEMDTLEGLPDRNEVLLALPSALLAGCGVRYRPEQVLDALSSVGFAEVTPIAPFESALRSAVLAFADGQGSEGRAPAISPACPAVVNLIELKFPSLLPQLAPFASCWEALQADYSGQRIAYTVSCPAQRSALLFSDKPGDARVELSRDRRSDRPAAEFFTPNVLRNEALRLLAAGCEHHPALDEAWVDDAQMDTAPVSSRQAEDAQAEGGETGDRVLTVTGIDHVLAVLEEIEDGLLPDVAVVEPYACAGGCFGSPLLAEDHHVALRRWRADPLSERLPAKPAAAAARRRPYTARPGIRLDTDIARAIQKLGRMQQIVSSLPGTDCLSCGAPSCAAFAEDIVLERVTVELCPYAPRDEEASKP